MRNAAQPAQEASTRRPRRAACGRRIDVRHHVAEEIAELKQQSGENILKFGTGELDRTLIAHELVDEFHFWVSPSSPEAVSS